MRDLTPRQSRTVSLLLLSTVVFMVGARAHAGAPVTQPVTQYVVIQPIDVCGTTGPSSATGCAPFNDQSLSPNPAQATLTTPIGFVDAATNVNITRAIWLQAGIDVTFLPIQEYNNTAYQAISDITCGTSTCTSVSFKALSSATQLPGAPPLIDSACKTNCTVPLAPTMANAINMFFVNSLTANNGAPSGFAWLNGNGVAIAADVFLSSRFDTLAHEIGHNLHLDHTTFGAGTLCKNTPSPQGCNVMDAGTIRVVPLTSGCSSSSTSDGALFDLDTGLCSASVPSAPRVPQADQLILGTSTTTQQGQALSSGFINPIPNVNAIAGGGDVAITVDYPPLHEAGGRQGQYIFALVLALPNGFKFGTNPFTPTGGTTTTGGTVELFTPPFQVLNGNNGNGNSNCLKPLSGAPSIECLEIDFVPGTFTANTSISFTSDIIDKNCTPTASTTCNATAAQLACTPPAPLGCLDLTYAFSDLLATSSAFVIDAKTGNTMANSQLPDPGVPPTIVDPAKFPSVANLKPPLTLTGFTQIPCTGATTAAGCPPLAHGDPVGPD